MQQLCNQNNGKLFINPNPETLVNYFNNSIDTTPLLINEKHERPIIDQKYLLIFLLITLSIEWFARKYKGYI